MKNKWLLLILVLAVILQGCAVPVASPTPVISPLPAATSTMSGPIELRVMTHDSFAVTEGVIQAFETQNNIKITFLKSGDAGSVLNKAILSKNAPVADVLYGVDNSFLSRALQADIYSPYDSPLLKQVPAQFQLDSSNRALPVDYGDVCVNYDKAYFLSKGLPVPQTLQDLVKPEYKGLLVVENPATSSPGLAFLLSTVAEFGESNYLDYWKSLRDNGVVVVNDWNTAYYTNFSGSSGKGAQPMVVSYGTSPAAEVMFATTPLTEAPTASIVGPNSCFRQVEFVGILKGIQQRAAAEKFVDFMLGQTFQEDMPAQMFVFPVNPSAKVPPEFTKYVQVPEKPAVVSPDLIASNRDAWIQAWSDAVLH